MGTMKKVNKSQKMLIILPIIILLGVLIFVVTPKGPILKALSDHELVEVSNMDDDKKENDQIIETEKEIVKIQIVAKETGLYKIEKKPEYSITSVDRKGEQLVIPILTEDHYSNYKKDVIGVDTLSSTSTKEDSSSEEIVSPPSFAQVTAEGKLKTYYLYMKKGESQYLSVERLKPEVTTIKLLNSEDTGKSQILVEFKEIASDEKSSLATKSNKESENITTTSTSFEAMSSLEDTKKLKGREKESKDSSATESKNESTDVSEKQKKIDVDDAEENPVAKDTNENEEGAKADLGTPKSYERILAVETKKTKKTLKDLTNQNYLEKDSLKAPVFISDTKQKDTVSETDEESPVIIRDAKITVKTGTTKFDNDNQPGNDMDENNNIVRTFDQISYLMSFSIQNTKKDITYTNIRYRLITKMPNAVEVTNSVPRNNGEIANGTYIDTDKGDGSQISEGVMESVISDSGQIFVPVILNVYGSTHLTEIQPTFELEIVDAKNEKTGEVETFNKSYDSSVLNNLKVDTTYVSAKPSIGVRLSQGQVLSSSVFGINNSNIEAYDIGIATVLQPLPGRDTGDYKGSTFPTGEISYTIKQKATYQIGSGAEQTMPESTYDPLIVKAYAPAENDRNTADWTKLSAVDVGKFERALSIPNANTGKIYTSMPTSDFEKSGSFDSGKFNVSNGERTINVKNTDYKGILNPYTFNMTGERTSSATDKSFSSLELVGYFDKEKLVKNGLTNKWTQYTCSYYVNEVTYDGITTSNNSTIDYPNVISPSGSYWGYISALVPTTATTGSYKIDGRYWQNAAPGTGNGVSNNGVLEFSMGQEAYLTNYTGTGNVTEPKGESKLIMWDPSGFKYDTRRDAIYDLWSTKNGQGKFKYGVAINLKNTPPYTMKVRKIHVDQKLYDWYDTPEEAEKHGDISAVYGEAKYDHNPSVYRNLTTYIKVPVTVTANSGSKTPNGNPITILGSNELLKADGTMVYEAPRAGTGNGNPASKSGDYTDQNGYGVYGPTNFDSNGNVLSKPMEYWNYIGDSAFVKNMSITTKTDVKKNLYQTKEDIDIQVTGVMTGSDDIKYDASLTSILPKGISYTKGTSVDAFGNQLDDPDIVINDDGTSTLKWTFSEIADIGKGLDVFFKATSDVSKLDFKDTGYTGSLQVKTIGEMWVSGNTSLNDKSSQEIRSSTDEFIEMLIQQVVLSKNADKPAIELGETDPLGVDNTITYKVKMINNSAASIPEARVLDVLPYDGDSRGTKYSGNYTIEELTVNDTSATISYTNSTTSESADPNQITGWSNYVSGTTPVSSIKNAKAVLVSVPSLEVNKEIELTIKIKPTNQKAGDVLVNDASMNSKLNLPVESQAVWTRVYGRELTGVVWYDDNLDGLIGNKAAGGLEEFAKDIPVKLYRTSLADENYKDKLIEASLTGEKFVDSSGNSLIKTDKDGKYTFAAIPEGTYVAEFVIGDRVEKKEFHVTKQQVGDDPTKNSKADPNTYKTPGYKAPLLEDLNSIENVNTPTYKIENVNLGLIRPATIRLFKFETGSAVDANGDGKLSDEEKATGKPLKGATFEIYKKGETTPIATADTDTNGYLMFEYLYEGSYQLKETKAPEGYELIKEPIDVEVVEGNQNVALFASDDKSTELPFTGANKWVFGLLIGATITMVAGFGGITYYYHQPKKKGE